MRILTLVAGFCLCMSTALAAAGETIAASPSPEPKADPVVCKLIAVTGSRVKREKICMTASQWKAQARGSRQFLDDIQRSAKNGTNGS